MYKACIFDLDGTLTNTLDSLTYSVNETMKEIGLPQITKISAGCLSATAQKSSSRRLSAREEIHLAHFDEAMAAYQRIFDVNCTYHVSPYPGIAEMLGEMKAMGT